MYEFSFPEIAKYSASEIHDNILYLEETLNNEPQNQSIIQYIKSGVNLAQQGISNIKDGFGGAFDSIKNIGNPHSKKYRSRPNIRNIGNESDSI